MEDYVEVKYGDHTDQYFKLFPPLKNASNVDDGNESKPIAIIIHGGFWKQRHTVSNALVDKLTPFFQSNSFWVCLVEYRRGNENDGGSGGWPYTNEDIILALNSLYCYVNTNNSAFLASNNCSVDLESSVIIGHSAGGTLSLWLSSSKVEYSVKVINPHLKVLFKPSLCVALAPIGDLIAGYHRRLSDDGDAIQNYMKCDPNIEDNVLSERSPYWLSSPHLMLPLTIPTILVAGEKDADVPADLVVSFYEQCLQTTERAPHENVKLLSIKDADHYDVIQSHTAAWSEIYSSIMLCFSERLSLRSKE